MNARATLLLGLIALTCLPAARAQDVRDDEADVFMTVERVWQAAQKADFNDVDEMLTTDFMGWGKNSPAPRSKTSTSKWNRFSEQLGRLARYELYPLAITIHDDVAVAQYLYSAAFKDKEGNFEMTNGRYTDVLVRTEHGWKFIAWHGGDD